ncbi:MAG TPA: hypothetical protein VLT33_07695 [Labilithrix sp.]|nr:hypothetical protein [Labilithrix sp.]
MRRLTLALFPALALLSACSAARPAPRAAVAVAPSAAPLPPPPSGFATLPLASGAAVRDPLPLSIQRLVSEQNSEMKDVAGLAAPVGDARGRARAAAEVSALADELRAIEVSLRAGAVESDRLDELVVKLQRLQTRIALLHEALRVASGPNAAVEVD